MSEGEVQKRRKRQKLLHFVTEIAASTMVLCMIAIAVVASSIQAGNSQIGSREGCPNYFRSRRDFSFILSEIGPSTFRRMYRMSEVSFRLLLDLIEPNMPRRNKRQRGCTPNGDINNEMRLLMALRFFAGGDKHDIATTHVVHPCEVYISVWRVVDAIHRTKALLIKFPDKKTQRDIANGFRERSDVGFDNCVGCVDGMIVWTCKPTETAEELGIGPGKFFSGRKKKFGLNFQGVCDHRRRFTDVYCFHPASASDFTMWTRCELRKLVETPGFLTDDLVLFGDLAYVNTPNLVTPFKSVRRSKDKDNFNFFHSQVRINIECTFGILVHRWGCLRKPMPMNLKVRKISALVVALCMLHNFCIDVSTQANDDRTVPPTATEDSLYIREEGGVYFERLATGGQFDPVLDGLSGLLDCGDRLEKEHRGRSRTHRIHNLPIWKMYEHVKITGMCRPNPN